jgi:hypothetical protein
MIASEEGDRTDFTREAQRINAETYDISMEGLTIDAILSAQDVNHLIPVIAGTQKTPRIEVNLDLEGQSVSLAGTVIWYNLFFPGTPPPNFKAGLYLIEPESSPSKQRWNDFVENIRI